MAKKVMGTMKVNYEYLDKCMQDNGVKATEVSALLGYAKNYISVKKSNNAKMAEETINALKDLLDIDLDKLIVNDKQEKPKEPKKSGFETYIVQELGEIKAALERIEQKIGEPQVISIPMKPQEMAEIVLTELLANGYCTMDDVIVEFNKHKIPMEYLNGAEKAVGCIRTTSGHAEKTRTYFLKK